MSAHIFIEAVSATCPECSWGSGPYDELVDAQAAVDRHNLTNHGIPSAEEQALDDAPLTVDMGGKTLEFHIPNDAIVTEAVGVLAYQRVVEGNLLAGTAWGINEIPVHHALGLLIGAGDRIRDYMRDISEEQE